ncbi:MAG: hypothetical protein HYY04_05140 [Chloroflexi bacterium]|nr:hypothetical protein [Chloroflexota bacterium]
MMTAEPDARFSAALEECCRRVQRGETIERCLTDYPAEYRLELARLVAVAERLGRLGDDPSPAFQARLELRLLAAADETRRGRPAGRWGRLGIFFIAPPIARAAVLMLVALIVLVGSGVGVVQAADQSLPDSPLYQVKTAREWLELALARDGDTRVDVHARQIGERGRELERAVRAGKPRRVVDTLALRVAWSTDRIVDLALEADARGNPRPAVRTLVAVRAMQRYLDRLTSQASPEVLPPLRRLQIFLEAQERRLAGRIGS